MLTLLPTNFLAAGGGGMTHEMITTMAVAVAAGIFLIIFSHRLQLPAIVLLLVGGVVLGPEVIGLVNPDVFGDGLAVIVSFAVGIILFEGGLTLELGGYRTAPTMIKRLLSVGVMTTWLLTALAIWLTVDIEEQYALLAASLVIVTGPTVITPLLKRIKVQEKLHSILHWEGVLIDPIGVFIALLCFEYVVSGSSGVGAVTNLGVRVLAGLFIGAGGGLGLSFLTKRRLIPEDMVNVGALGMAVVVFGLAEAVQPEAGLLSVTVAGFFFGATGSFQVKQVRQFKSEITELLIGTLFMLLAARLTFDQFMTFGVRGYVVVAIVMLLVRPISIMLCSTGLDVTGRERAFLAWVAPRGIVAASMASLFAISMTKTSPGVEVDPTVAANAQFVETFTYSVIISTIMIQGLSAGFVAKLLGLQRPAPTGWLIVGAHALSRRAAEFLRQTAELPVMLVDTNPRLIRLAQDEGFRTMLFDARDEAIQERAEVQDLGNMLALTDNEDLNVRLCQIWSEFVGSEHVFRCHPAAGDTPEEAPPDSGVVVWPRLPRPTLVAGELNRGEATVLKGGGNVPAFGQLAMPLISVHEGKVVFRNPNATDDEDVSGPTLYLQRAADYLRRSLRPELITTIDANDIRTLFTKIMELVIQVQPQISRDDVLAELLDRETNFPTALGHGVAVPHAYAPIDARLCAIIRVPEGVDFKAHDREPVRLIFFVLSPIGDPEGHLATLADIARRVIDPKIREGLINAASALEVIRIVNQSG